MGEPGGEEDGESGEGGEDVVLLTRGEGEEEKDDGGPEEEKQSAATLEREVVAAELAAEDLGAAGAAEEGRGPGGGLEDEGGPGHEPEEAESPEEPEGRGVVVVGDAEVEVAEQVLVHEVEPEPAADVAVGGQGHEPVAEREREGVLGYEAEGGGMAFGGIGQAGEEVPGRGDEQEGFEGGPGMEVSETAEGAFDAACEEEIERDDSDGEDDADEAFAEDVEGAGGGEEAAVEAQMRRGTAGLFTAACGLRSR